MLNFAFEDNFGNGSVVFDVDLGDATPYFTGAVNGARNNWNGEVGFKFTPNHDLVVSALGRGTNDGDLDDDVRVTLWNMQTQ